MATTLTADICRHVANSTPEERVERGARWLDENFPGWEGRIDIDTLDISSGTYCICGQVFDEDANRLMAAGADGSIVSSGFDYGYSTLFTEANSWISAMVGPAVPTSEGQMAGLVEFTGEQKDRKAIVSQGLGFTAGQTTYVTVAGAFPSRVTYADLTRAWTKLIQDRIDNGTCTKAPEPLEVG